MTAPAIDPHADKYNDPRVRITPRGILLGVFVVLFGMVGAGLSIYMRRTGLTETTRFWGDDTIVALQLGERMELRPRGESDFQVVELTGTPGLGHLRRALLEESHYDWTTEQSGSVEELRRRDDSPAASGETSESAIAEPLETDAPERNAEQADSTTKTPPATFVQLRLTDPTAHRFELVEIDLDLASGWVGPSDGERRVQMNPWVQPKLRNYISTLMTVSQKRYDMRP